MAKSHLHSGWFLGIAALAVLAFLATRVLEFGNTDPRRPGVPQSIEALSSYSDTNVLFVLIDTLRAHRLSAYGYERETSPTLDYVASTGVRFAKHLSQSSWTKCSMASLWTGLNPKRTGVLLASHATPTEATMPAEILQAAGFRTAGIFRNGWVAPNFGFDQGFEVYERPSVGASADPMRVENPHITLEGTDHDTVDTAIEFLRLHGQDRWFLYVHLMDVHQYLYDAETAVFGSSYSDIYDNSILHTDNVVGRLLAHLANQGLLEKTLVVLSADHGEAFQERGFEGHARYVYRETTEVPFVLGFPFLLNPGIVVESRTRNVDVWPTILDLLGLPALPDTDGRSLVPDILAASRGEPARDTPPGFAHIEQGWGRQKKPGNPMIAVAHEGFRFLQARDPRGRIREELFDSNTDPQELLNVLEEKPEVAARMRELATQYLDSPAPPWGVETPTVELDAMELNQLRALGYAVP
jgi:arylsulfatase A-like enzyme